MGSEGSCLDVIHPRTRSRATEHAKKVIMVNLYA
jgi:hypothetical protein